MRRRVMVVALTVAGEAPPRIDFPSDPQQIMDASFRSPSSRLAPSEPSSAPARAAAPLSYALITPARDEVAFIAATIESVIAQTVRPVRWIIVSDGSTDGTDDVVRRYAAVHAWIELVQRPLRTERHFGGKVHAFNAGLARLREIDYDLIGNLDADVSFEPDYFSFLLAGFQQNPRLGLAGTNYYEGGLRYDFRFTSIEDVPGACQLFRRECFEGIGGYDPIRAGGIDLVAVLRARMHGWETRAFTDRFLIHHRAQGTAMVSWWLVPFVDGSHDYRFGCHPLWEVFRVVYRMTREPWLVGGILLLAGYLWAMARRVERPVSPELVRFRRHEQMRRLRAFVRRVAEHGSCLCITLGCATCRGATGLGDFFEAVG